jgi:hypothetical protein
LTDVTVITKYEIVGYIGLGSTFSSDTDWTEELKAEIRPKVCELGADTASLSGSSTNSGGDSSTSILALLRKPDEKVFGSEAFLSHQEPALRKKASFDLDCGENALTIIALGGTSRGVKGCDTKATYVFVRSGMESGNWQRE